MGVAARDLLPLGPHRMHRSRMTPKLAMSTLVTLALLALCACHAPSVPALQLDAAASPLDTRDFPAPARLLQGFDRRDATGAWRAGDAVLFGLRLRKDGGVRNWLLQLRLLDPLLEAEGDGEAPAVDWWLRINGQQEHFASRMCRVEAVVMDEAGAVLGRSEPRLPRDFLDSGVAAACELVERRLPEGLRGAIEPDKAVVLPVRTRELAQATVCAVSLLQVVQEDDVLAPLLWQVVEKPSLWSVISNLGASVVLRPQFHRTMQRTSPLPGNYDPTWSLPMELEVNGRPALDIELLVADPSPPFALCGGLFGARARHPEDPELEFSLLLLSARRGR